MTSPNPETHGLSDADVRGVVLATRDKVPPDISEERFAAAVDYSAKRYGVGLAHYEDVIRRVGFVDRRRALDVGSGAGHWCVALARYNSEVLGIERAPEYVEIARAVADALGLDRRVSYRVASAEDVDLPGSHFDLVCCHSVLMFVNHELVARNIARWTSPNGLFYCGYTTWGARAAEAVGGLIAENPARAKAQLKILIGDALFRAGVGRTFGTGVRCLSREELVALFGAVGLDFVESPGLQDGRRSFLGHPCTIDLLCKKTDPMDAFPLSVQDEPGQPESVSSVARLIDLGLPRLALEALESSNVAREDPRLLELAMRARLKMGQPLGDEERHLEQLPLPARYWLSALDACIRADYRGAVEASQAIDAPHPDRDFLIAACELLDNRPAVARDMIMSTYAQGETQLRTWAVLTVALLDLDEAVQARHRAIPLLDHLARTGGADRREFDDLVHRLHRAGAS